MSFAASQYCLTSFWRQTNIKVSWDLGALLYCLSYLQFISYFVLHFVLRLSQGPQDKRYLPNAINSWRNQTPKWLNRLPMSHENLMFVHPKKKLQTMLWHHKAWMCSFFWLINHRHRVYMVDLQIQCVQSGSRHSIVGFFLGTNMKISWDWVVLLDLGVEPYPWLSDWEW